MTCADADRVLVAYWLHDLAEDEQERLEDHVFGCAACARRSAIVAELVELVRGHVPPALTEAAIAALGRRGTRLQETVVQPGERVRVVLGPTTDLLVHRLQADLSAVEHLELEAIDGATGTKLISFPDVAFEREQNQVNVACTRHYAMTFPPDGLLRLVAVEPGQRRVVGEYHVYHVVPTAPPT